MKSLIQILKGIIFYSLLFGAILAPMATVEAINDGSIILAVLGILFSMIFFIFLGKFSEEEVKDYSGYNSFKRWCNEGDL